MSAKQLSTETDPWRVRVEEGDWSAITDEVNEYGGALLPRLLPIARDWWGKLGRPAPWPDTLDEWLEMCHEAGQGEIS